MNIGYNKSPRSGGIEALCDTASSKWGADFTKLTGLDFFAREGDWCSYILANLLKEFEAWEINPAHEDLLRSNLPSGSIVKIGDSFKLSAELGSCHNFNVVLIDNPQGCFGDKKQYCEHFEALPRALNLVSSNSFVFFNVKTEPFNYDLVPEWRRRRENFYNTKFTEKIPLDFLLTFYRSFFNLHGFKTLNFSYSIRPQESGLFLFLFHLLKDE